MAELLKTLSHWFSAVLARGVSESVLCWRISGPIPKGEGREELALHVTKAPDQSARFCNHVNNNTITIYGQHIGPCPMMWNNANTDLHVSTCKLEM